MSEEGTRKHSRNELARRGGDGRAGKSTAPDAPSRRHASRSFSAHAATEPAAKNPAACRSDDQRDASMLLRPARRAQTTPPAFCSPHIVGPPPCAGPPVSGAWRWERARARVAARVCVHPTLPLRYPIDAEGAARGTSISTIGATATSRISPVRATALSPSVRARSGRSVPPSSTEHFPSPFPGGRNPLPLRARR